MTPEAKSSPLVNPASQFVRLHIPRGCRSSCRASATPSASRCRACRPAFDAFVAKRIVDLAAQVHAPVAAAADCTPNVHVIFSPQPQAQIDDIARRRDVLIGFHFPAQAKALTTVTRPIQSWYVTRVRGHLRRQLGMEVDSNCPMDPRIGPCGEKPTGRAGSRLGNDMSAEVVHSLVIADADKVSGAKIGAIADYIAVLSLAGGRAWRGATPRSRRSST